MFSVEGVKGLPLPVRSLPHCGFEKSGQVGVLVGDPELVAYFLPVPVDCSFGDIPHLGYFLGPHTVLDHVANGNLRRCHRVKRLG